MDQTLTKIVFELKIDADGYPPVAFESMWGIETHRGAHVIDNVPYYVYGVSKGDTVAASVVDGEHRALSVIERAGHSTLRVFAEPPGERAAIIAALERMGARCAVTQRVSLFAVDIPPDADFATIDGFLAASCDGDRVAYEDACLQHGGLDRDRMSECATLATIPLRLN
ncbi:hypothetical protein WI79_28940 [Burkholderia ubonensis]|nr:hypothetical protein WI79_28940 [Burkholderia ubonensis]